MSDVKVRYQNGVAIVEGRDKISPKGTPGFDPFKHNFWPYTLPGEDCPPPASEPLTAKFTIAKGPGFKRPVTSNKWWSAALLQHEGQRTPDGKAGEQGWVRDNNGEISSTRMVNEPLALSFVDFDGPYADLLCPRGLRLWNQSGISSFTGNKEVGLAQNVFSTGNAAQTNAAFVTVGLQGVRPLKVPTKDRLSNVVIDDYTEFHVDMAYGGNGNRLAITMASGAPFVWFERTEGTAPFQVWAGSPVSKIPSGNQDTYKELIAPKDFPHSLGFDLGMRYLPPNVGDTHPIANAGYFVLADKGEWKKQDVAHGDQNIFTWINTDAQKVVFAAIPHNLDLVNSANSNELAEFLGYARWKITSSEVVYPPLNSQTPAYIDVNDRICLPGHNQYESKITVAYRWHGRPFLTSGSRTTACLALLPHHRKYLHPKDAECLARNASGAPKFTYRTLKGEMQLYTFEVPAHGPFGFVRILETHGLLPFISPIPLCYAPKAPGNRWPYDIVYDSLKQWFWKEEPANEGHASSFAANYFSYGGPATNAYLPDWAGVFESLVVADQLSDSAAAFPVSAEIDDELGLPKRQVAGIMRDKILEVLKQLVHQWFDVYTAQCLQYNAEFQTICGYPAGFGAVAHLNDHHFHWGYFLRAAAAIGRHDPAWLDQHWSGINLLLHDAANWGDDNRFPVLRTFSPFYGHSWASGIGMLDGQDQESTSEALNFAFGMVELGGLREDQNLVDIGLWLYEEEACATEQYWLNVDARLDSKPVNGFFNGNWPKDYVSFDFNGEAWNSTLTTLIGQKDCQKVGHFGGEQGSFMVQMLPVGAMARLERHPKWLNSAYDDYLRSMDVGKDSVDAYSNIIAIWQAMLPQTSRDDSLKLWQRRGITGALARVNKPHPYHFAVPNAVALYWILARNAYTARVPVHSNAIHYAAFKDYWNRTSYMAYNPSKKPLTGVKITDPTGNVLHEFGSIPALTMAFSQGPGSPYRPKPYEPPKGRLYLRKDGLDPQPGSASIKDELMPYPTDLTATQSSIVKLPVGDSAIGLKFATENLTGKLVAAEKLRYTSFSIYVNAALRPGITWDPETEFSPAVVAFELKYVFGDKTERVESYYNAGQFNLETTNTWLNRNNLTEYWTTQAPIPLGLGPSKPDIKGSFKDSVAKGSITLTVWQPKGPKTNSYDIYLSVDSDPLSHRASWIRPPYEAA
jgi:hypothetical protein